MPNLTAGQSATIDIPTGMPCYVSTTQDAYVDLVAGAPGSGYTSDRLVGGRAGKLYGPWTTPAKITIRSVLGTATYGGAYAGDPIDLGQKSAAAIVAINAAIAAGTASYPAASTVVNTDTGARWTLSGLGTAAAFAVDGDGVMVYPGDDNAPPLITAQTQVITGQSGYVVRANQEIKLAPGTGKRMLTNYAATQAWTDLAPPIWAGRDLVMSVPGHNLTVGDYYHLDNPLITSLDQSAFKGVMLAHTIIDANTIVCSINRTPPIGTVPSATGWRGRSADKNIKISVEGALNYDVANNPGAVAQDLMVVVLSSVANADIDVTGINTAKYVLLIAGSTGGRYRCRGGVTTNVSGSDLVKLYGPSTGDVIECVRGRSGDDAVSVQTREPAAYAQYMPCWGDIIGARIRDVSVQSPIFGMSAAVAYGSPYEYLDVEFDGIHGVINGPAVRAQGGAGLTDSLLHSVVVRNVTARCSLGLHIGSGTATHFGRVELQRMVHNPQLANDGMVEVKSQAHIKLLVLRGLESNLGDLITPSAPGLATGNGYQVNQAGGLAIGTTIIPVDTGTGIVLAGSTIVTQDGNRYAVLAGTAGAGIIAIPRPGLRTAVADNSTISISSTTLHVLLANGLLDQVLVEGASVNGNKTNNRFISTSSGSQVQKITLRSSHVQADRAINIVAGAAVAPQVLLEDNYLNVEKGVVAGASCDVVAVANVVLGAATGLVQQTAGTVTLKHLATKLNGTSVVSSGAVSVTAL